MAEQTLTQQATRYMAPLACAKCSKRIADGEFYSRPSINNLSFILCEECAIKLENVVNNWLESKVKVWR